MAQVPSAFRRAAIDTGGFRFGKLADVYDLNFLPGGVKYGDLPGILALATPVNLWLAGEGKTAPPILRAAYQTSANANKLTLFAGRGEETDKAAVGWLLKP